MRFHKFFGFNLISFEYLFNRMTYTVIIFKNIVLNVYYGSLECILASQYTYYRMKIHFFHLVGYDYSASYGLFKIFIYCFAGL